jgi:hypothetical protein
MSDITLERRSPRVRIVIGLLVAALAALAMASSSTAPSPADGAPRGHTLVHNSFSRLAAAWWTWALSQPAATNPLTDTTGEFCAEGQTGRTWFLAGPAGDGVVNRSCTIPAGRKLFFPLVNVFNGATPDDPAELQTVAAQRRLVADYQVRRSFNLTLSVDGISRLHAVRYEDSKVFKVVLPDGNLFGVPAGTVVFPTVDSGYYARLSPLHPGKHVLHFTGQLPDVNDQTHNLIDVTYELTVKRRAHSS